MDAQILNYIILTKQTVGLIAKSKVEPEFVRFFFIKLTNIYCSLELLQNSGFSDFLGLGRESDSPVTLIFSDHYVSLCKLGGGRFFHV